MKLRTSYFNLTVLKKDLTRFSPVWGLYGIFQVLYVILMWGDESNAVRFAINAADVMMSMGILNFLYAGLCAFLLFGDLFSPRMCNMLHAFPMRREGWYLTHLTSGFLFCLLPNLAGALLAALLLQQYAYGAFLWLAVSVLQYLFFFAAAVFATMCSGNAIGGMAIYGLFNFLAALVAWLVVTFYEPMIYGVKINAEQIALYSPVLGFTNSQYFDFRYSENRASAVFSFQPEDWRFLAIAAAVAVVLLALSLLIYRRRQLESAGDMISLRPVAPVFLVLYTLCVGAVLYFVAEAFSNGLQYVFLLIGFAIGFFTGKMLLEKRVNVFRLKNAAQFGILVAVFVVSVVIAIADPFGVTRYVPEADQVVSVMVSPYSSDYYISNESCVLTQPEDIERIVAMHAELVQTRPQDGESNVSLRYQTKTGIVDRSYPVVTGSDAWKLLREYYASVACVFGTENVDEMVSNMVEISVYPHDEQIPQVRFISEGSNGTRIEVDDKEIDIGYLSVESFNASWRVRGMVDALVADCQAGKLIQHWEYRDNTVSAASVGSVTITYEPEPGVYAYREIVIYSDCKNTVEFLKDLATLLNEL